MKKIIISVIASILVGQTAFSQNADHIEGGRFIKRIEYNVIMTGLTEADNTYNLDGKSILDRLFFGETNYPVEFVLRTSFAGASAFRISKTPSGKSYRLEVMHIPDNDAIVDILTERTGEIRITSGELFRALSMEARNLIREHNKDVAYTRYSNDKYKPDQPKPKKFTISKQLAEALQDKIALLINNFKAEGIPPMIADGEEVTFRCTVGNELWTLIIHCPQRRALQLANLCKQIMTDANGNKLDESGYLKLLDEIEL